MAAGENSEEQLREAVEHAMTAYRRYRAAAPGLFEELADAGLPVEQIQELRPISDRRALPILLKWLPQVHDSSLKDDIIQTLAAKWAQPEGPRAVASLLDGLDNSNDEAVRGLTLRGMIGSALLQVTDDSLYGRILAFAADDAQGTERAHFILALGKYPRRRTEAAPVLTRILADETNGLEYMAAKALVKLGYGTEIIPDILRLERTGRYTRGDIQKLLRRIRTAPQ